MGTLRILLALIVPGCSAEPAAERGGEAPTAPERGGDAPTAAMKAPAEGTERERTLGPFLAAH